MNETRRTEWERLISSFLVNKAEAELEKYLKELIKKIGEAYKKEDYFGDKEKELFFDPKKNRKEDGQTALEFLGSQLDKIESWSNPPGSIDFTEVRTEISSKKAEISVKYEPVRWITWASKNAGSVSFATHVSKLTHSAIDSPSIFDEVNVSSRSQISTSSLKKKEVDGAVRGNQYAPIYQFLELTISGVKLAELFSDLNCNVLCSFAQTAEQNTYWNEGFRKALRPNDVAAHGLLKQVYFPLAQNSFEYHLLCNLVSSSFAQRIFDLTKKSKNDLLLNNKYSVESFTSFPNMASLAVTASNPGNASQLNGKRGGKLKLFSSAPPTWRSDLNPPIYRSSFYFDPSISRQVKEEVDYLRDFLQRFEKIELSIKDPKRMKWIEQWVGIIVDEILFYIGSIQSLPAGWTDTPDIKLKPEHQFVLDPYREDETFQAARAGSDWLKDVCGDFADWLNNKLVGKDKQFTPQAEHKRLWQKLIEPELREFMSTVEYDRKHKMEVLS